MPPKGERRPAREVREGVRRTSDAPAKESPPGAAGPAGVLHRIAGDLKTWVLVLGLGLGALGASAAYFGLFLLASTFVSIFIVSLTLYAFLRYWPEEEEKPGPPSQKAPANDRAGPEAAGPPRNVTIPAVRLDGPPRARMMLALREIVRRQDNYKISKQGAERFAKVIRYLLQAEER